MCMFASYSNEKSETRISEAPTEENSSSSSIVPHEVCIHSNSFRWVCKSCITYFLSFLLSFLLHHSSGVKEWIQSRSKERYMEEELLNGKVKN